MIETILRHMEFLEFTTDDVQCVMSENFKYCGTWQEFIDVYTSNIDFFQDWKRIIIVTMKDKSWLVCCFAGVEHHVCPQQTSVSKPLTEWIKEYEEKK